MYVCVYAIHTLRAPPHPQRPTGMVLSCARRLAKLSVRKVRDCVFARRELAAYAFDQCVRAWLFARLSVCLSLFLSVSIYLSIWLSVWNSRSRILRKSSILHCEGHLNYLTMAIPNPKL